MTTQYAVEFYMESMATDGVLALNEWTTGRGKYTQQRSLPFGVVKVALADVQALRTDKTISRLDFDALNAFKNEHPRAKYALLMSEEVRLQAISEGFKALAQKTK